MSGKPTGVLILAILQLIGALLNLWAGGLLIMAAMLLGPFAFLFAFPALILFIVGLIGLILFYGLYTLKGWAWLWALIFNLLAVLGGVLRIGALMTDYIGLAGFIVNLIVFIYLLLPSTRAHFR
ncbi:MAG: hypothetical protein EAX87_04440 [Candidatus Thorarchaeota archaeon]|nr:hypothetical protein [Candidatus Thorarchaeota archaeon]